VANGGCFGRGFWVCPEARIDDGLLDIVLASAVSRLTLLRLLPRVMRGGRLAESVARTYRACRVTFQTSHPAAVEADGEILSVDARRVEIEILPRRLRVIV
jgi:diacylglycerol kinase (ATP)